MQPTQSLPENYHLESTLDLSKNKKLMILLNVVGIVVFLLSAAFFATLALWLRGDEAIGGSFGDNLMAILGPILVFAVMIFLHEGIHGFFAWRVTRARPSFGFKGLYFYTSMPDWYLPRKPYLVIALAPLVLMSVVGIALLPFVPSWLLSSLLLGLILNAAGSVGDAAIVIAALRKPATMLANDYGDGVHFYCSGTLQD